MRQNWIAIHEIIPRYSAIIMNTSIIWIVSTTLKGNWTSLNPRLTSLHTWDQKLSSKMLIEKERFKLKMITLFLKYFTYVQGKEISIRARFIQVNRKVWLLWLIGIVNLDWNWEEVSQLALKGHPDLREIEHYIIQY